MMPSSQFLKKTPPWSQEAERAVLGMMLADNRNIDRVASMISQEDFYSEAHKHIYNGILASYKKNGATDVVILTDEFRAQGLLTLVGGASYLSSLLDGLSKTSIESCCKIIKDKSILRKLIVSSAAVIDSCYSGDMDTIQLLIEKIQQTKPSLETPTAETIQHILDSFQEYQNVGEGIKLGVPTLDKLMNGLNEGEVLYLLGRKIGKSAFAQNVLRYFTIYYPQFAAVFFCLEMPAAQIGERLLMIETNKSKEEIKKLAKEEINAIMERYKNTFFITRPTLSLWEIKQIISKLKFKANVKLVIIDFLTRIKTAIKDEYEFLRHATKDIKDMAKELKVAMIVLSQVGREQGGTGGQPLTMASARGSGTIEEDADFVLGLYRPELNLSLPIEVRQKYRNLMILQVLASRRTELKDNIFLKFNKTSLRIEEVT